MNYIKSWKTSSAGVYQKMHYIEWWIISNVALHRVVDNIKHCITSRVVCIKGCISSSLLNYIKSCIISSGRLHQVLQYIECWITSNVALHRRLYYIKVCSLLSVGLLQGLYYIEFLVYQVLNYIKTCIIHQLLDYNGGGGCISSSVGLDL